WPLPKPLHLDRMTAFPGLCAHFDSHFSSIIYIMRTKTHSLRYADLGYPVKRPARLFHTKKRPTGLLWILLRKMSGYALGLWRIKTMARPRKYYVLLSLDHPPKILNGSDAARKAGVFAYGYKTLTNAQEYIAWWQYERQAGPPRSERYVPKHLRPQRTCYYRPGDDEPYLTYG